MLAIRRAAAASAFTLCGLLLGAGETSLDAFLSHLRTQSGELYGRHVSGTLVPADDGAQTQTRVEYDGLRMTVRNCSAGACTGTYFDGERNYRVDANDTMLLQSPAIDSFTRTIRTISSYAFAEKNFTRSGGSVIDRGVRRDGGKILRALEVHPAGGDTLVALIDLRTGLLNAIVSKDERQGLEYRDYRDVGGIQLPFEIWTAGKRVTQYAARSIERDPFSPPRGLVPVFGPRTTASTMVAGSNVPIVSCAIGGHSVPCLLDTGNFSMSMSLELAEKLGLELFGSIKVSGIGQYVTGYVRGPALRVGSAEFPPALYVVLHDLHRLGYDLVLGTDVLANTNVWIDYAKRELTILAPDGGAFAGTAVPISFESFIPVAQVGLGPTMVPLAIDTGDQSAVNLAYDFYSRNQNLFTAQGKADVAGIGGTSDQITGEIPSVTIGPFEVRNQKIGSTRNAQPTAKGHLGGGFLSHFNLFLDYARSRIGLLPRTGDAAVRLK